MQNIVLNQPIDLQEIILLITEHYSKIVLQFYPDNFKNFHFKTIKFMPQDFIMVSTHFDLGKLWLFRNSRGMFTIKS